MTTHIGSSPQVTWASYVDLHETWSWSVQIPGDYGVPYQIQSEVFAFSKGAVEGLFW